MFFILEWMFFQEWIEIINRIWVIIKLIFLEYKKSGTWNLKTLTRVLKVSWSSQLLYKILWSSFERKFWKDKLHFFQKIPPRSKRVNLINIRQASVPEIQFASCSKVGIFKKQRANYNSEQSLKNKEQNITLKQ